MIALPTAPTVAHCACGEKVLLVGTLRAVECDACRARRRRAPAVGERTTPERIAAAAIPDAYRGASRESWNPALSAWPEKLPPAAALSPFVLLWGPTGTGKTHIATALLREAIEAGADGRWVSMVSLPKRLVTLSHDDCSRRILELQDTPVLLLDEIAKDSISWASNEEQESTPWPVRVLDEIVSARYDAGRRTIFTTNRGPEWLVKLNQRMASRVLSGLVVKVSGDDARLRRRPQ